MPNRKRKNILNEDKNRIPGKSGGGRAKGLERFDELRMNAERELKENPDAHIEMRIGEASELIHEIRVYQIELEMQNEELRGSQSRLEELSEKYIDLYDFAPTGYMTLDETGAILEINLTGALMMGAPRKTLIKTPFRRHIARESQDTFHFHFREVLGSVANKTCELNIKRLDGSIFSAKLNSQSPPYATTGTQQIRVAMIDISNTKEMEDSLRVSEESFRALTENSGDMIMRFDHDFRYPNLNKIQTFLIIG